MNDDIRSKKAREAHADFLLKVSSSLFTAFFVAILIVPMSTIAGAAFHGKPPASALEVYKNLFGSWYGVLFLIAEICLFFIVVKTKRRGLDILDDLDAEHSDNVKHNKKIKQD